jgi:hypothetical protein
MKNNLILLFLLPILLLNMMMHNMEVLMKRKRNEEESGDEEMEPTRFVGRFSDYDQIVPNLPEHEMKMGGGMALLLWGFSMMTLKLWGAVVLWCAGAALLHCMIPDDDEPAGGKGHFYK